MMLLGRENWFIAFINRKVK